MPNYCLNRATLRHRDPAQLKRLLKAYSRGGPGVGREFLPPPAGCDERTWRICYWGTKWDFSEETFGRAAESVHGVVRLDFDTANTPPLGIYLELLRQGFKVEAMYCEMGQQFHGRVGAPEIRHFTLNSSDIRQIMEHVDAELIEAFGLEEFFEEEDEVDEGGDEATDADASVERRWLTDPWEIKQDLASFVSTHREKYLAYCDLLRSQEDSSGNTNGGHDVSA
jgi:hypothetical protein